MAESEALDASDELDEDQQARLGTITQRIEDLEDRPTSRPPETLAIAGAVITLGFHGKPDIHTGYIKPEDAPGKAAKTKTVMQTQDDGTVAEVTVEDRSPLPASLIESLTAQRSAALNAALLERPDIALAATVHAMALQVFYNGARGDTVLQIMASGQSLHRVTDSPAHAAIETLRDQWGEHIPGDPADLFAWCLAQPQDRLMGLLAFCAGQTVNAVLLKSERAATARMEHAALLADALKLDMAAWFTPTAANYFSRVSKAAIIETLRDIKGDVAPAWSGMKKADLASLAERTAAGTGWLPEPLRAPATAPATEG